MTVPCLNCKDRYVGCHGHCPRYITYKEELSKKRGLVNQVIESYWSERKYKSAKRAERYKKH